MDKNKVDLLVNEKVSVITSTENELLYLLKDIRRRKQNICILFNEDDDLFYITISQSERIFNRLKKVVDNQ